ncbi:class I SAM-dependent methyltransferase [Nocardia sp. NPDC049220]|uniref:class I SAM-dependent methyltransferase n=1 Tax=Nocardia sp. NPDC049220 TaxID=3155273 RepID=UPI0033D6634E
MTRDAPDSATIDSMPRGGPDASWFDRRLQTDRREYLDRYDVPDERKQRIVAYLDRVGERTGHHKCNAQLVLEQIAGIVNPQILELGAGHGKLSAYILALHPTAEVTVTDLDPKSVATIEAGPLGAHTRATAKVTDATGIDAPDHSYDLVVFASAFHHLPPRAAHRAIAEATRAGKQFLVFDLQRPPSIAAALLPLLILIPAIVLVLANSSPAAVFPVLHDAYISMLRSYSKSAFTALGAAADPAITVEFVPTKRQVAVIYTNPRAGSPS